jgi:hypothetical protein
MVAIALDDFLRSFRKFNCAGFFATQHLDLPPELSASLFANCSRFFAFASSAADAAFLAKEFGGPEGTLVAERLPELQTGQAFVKVRGEPVRMLRVLAPDWKTTPQLVKDGRALSLRLGASREQIDKEIEQRRRRFMPSSGTASRDAEDVRRDNGTSNLPEGYDGY